MSRTAAISASTTVLSAVWANAERYLSLGDLRDLVDAAAALPADAAIFVSDVLRIGTETDGKYYFRRLDAHASNTLADKVIDVQAAEPAAEQKPTK